MNGAQNTQVQQLLLQLADINGLDRIGWWPLAPGWWGIFALFVIILVAGIILSLRHRAYRRSWKYDAGKTLTFLADHVDAINAREILIKLSALLRRIAIRRFSRAECAGLKGSEWAQWLTKNDPSGFDWRAHVKFLTETPYALPENIPSPDNIKLLINATKKWVQ